MNTIEYIYRMIRTTAVALFLALAAEAPTISMPVYVNGVLSSSAGNDIQVVATFHYITAYSSPVSGPGKRAIHVHLSITNNQPTDLDFDPAETSMSMGGVMVVPMDEQQLHSLGNSMMRRHWGNVGSAEFQDARTIRETMFPRNTVGDGKSVAGDLYFEIPKDQREKFKPATAHLTVLIQGAVYQLQF
jgi:hypothetical protein